MRFIRGLIFCCVLVLAGNGWAGTLRVSLHLSDGTAPYQEFAAAFSEAVQSKKLSVEIVTDGRASDLTVAVGSRALQEGVNGSFPVLAVMLPRQTYQSLTAALPDIRRKQVAAIYLDQPWERQFQHIHCTLTGARRVGVLYFSGAESDLLPMREAAGENLRIETLPIALQNDIYPAMERLLNDVDVLLAIPDSQIYNSSNIRNILLTSYRHRVPLFGFSASFVKAGALASIYTAPSQLAQQAVSAVAYFEANRRLPESRYPTDFEIAQNPRVANSLGLNLPSPQQVHACIVKQGRAR